LEIDPNAGADNTDDDNLANAVGARRGAFNFRARGPGWAAAASLSVSTPVFEEGQVQTSLTKPGLNRLGGDTRIAGATAEQEGEEDAGDETSHVRHVGDTADVLGGLVRVGDGTDATK
jgi:hypothetical protein